MKKDLFKVIPGFIAGRHSYLDFKTFLQKQDITIINCNSRLFYN